MEEEDNQEVECAIKMYDDLSYGGKKKFLMQILKQEELAVLKLLGEDHIGLVFFVSFPLSPQFLFIRLSCDFLC